jgi:hypothetical protein
MENNERDRKLDQWLDEALSQYSAAEPRLGLEQRILAGVHAEERAQTGRKNWWRWMPAFAAIAAVLIVMVAVRPYWEQKEPAAKMASSNIATYSASAPASQNEVVARKLEEPKVSVAKKSIEADKSSRMKQGWAAPRETITLSKDATLDERREAEVSPKNGPVAASRAYRYGNEENAKALAKESDKAASEVLKQPAQGRRFQSLMGRADAPPAPPPPAPKPESGQTTIMSAPATAAVAANEAPTATTRDKVHAAKSELSATETIEVQGTAQNVIVPVVPSKTATDAVVGGIVAAGKAGLAEATAGAKTVTAKAKAAVNKPKSPIPTDALGMAPMRTDLKQVPPGPRQQFPTPTPLSDEEKMALAASKQMKGKPATEVPAQKPDGDTNAIEIKKIEIAPLPGPPK